MADGLRVNKRSLRAVLNGLRDVIDAPTEAGVLFRIGEKAEIIILDRTNVRFRSSEEGAFRPYTAAYAKTKGVAPSNVDLFLTGEMAGNIDINVGTRNEVVLGFDDPEQEAKAEFHQFGTGNLPAREWFDIGRTRDEQIIFDELIFGAILQKRNSLRSIFM